MATCFLCFGEVQLPVEEELVEDDESSGAENSLILCDILELQHLKENAEKKDEIKYCSECKIRIGNIQVLLQELERIENQVIQEKYIIELQLKGTKISKGTGGDLNPIEEFRNEIVNELRSNTVQAMLSKIRKKQVGQKPNSCRKSTVMIMKDVRIQKIPGTDENVDETPPGEDVKEKNDIVLKSQLGQPPLASSSKVKARTSPATPPVAMTSSGQRQEYIPAYQVQTQMTQQDDVWAQVVDLDSYPEMEYAESTGSVEIIDQPYTETEEPPFFISPFVKFESVGGEYNEGVVNEEQDDSESTTPPRENFGLTYQQVVKASPLQKTPTPTSTVRTDFSGFPIRKSEPEVTPPLPPVVHKNSKGRTLHRPRNFTCGICGEGFEHYTEIQAHEKLHVVPKTNGPSSQSQNNKNKQLSRPHSFAMMRKRSAVNRYPTQKSKRCDECGKILSTKTTWRNHVNTVHRGLWRFKCHLLHCNFGCQLRAHLRDHMIRSHSDERNFKCDYCDKTFQFQTNLNNHIKIHLRHSNEGKLPHNRSHEYNSKMNMKFD